MFGASKTASVSGGGADPYFDYVTMLLTGNGTNGAQNNTFLDSSSNAFSITRNGNTTQGSFSPYGSNWGNYFNGTTDYLNGPTNNSAFDFSTGDFTVECWVFATSNSDANIYTNFGPSGAGGLVVSTSSGYLYVWNYTAASLSMTANTLLPLNQWVHVAVTRSGNNFTIWQNGVSVATQTISVTLKTNASSPVCIGGIYSGGGSPIPSWKGYISNLRVTKGGALYTSTFTPSTTPLTTTVSSGTVSWLTCQSNRFIDNSANAFAMTIGGTPSVQRFSPFNPTASYSTATIGGSGYFDGSGDYLTGPTGNANLNLSSGSWTVDGWFYTTKNTVGGQGIIAVQSSGLVGWVLDVGVEVANNICFFNYNGSDPTSSSIGYNGGSYGLTIKPFQWNYFAVTSNGSTINLYVNGTLLGTSSGTVNFNSSSKLSVGIWPYSTGIRPFQGYISDVRIIKGTQLSGAVPTSPLTAVTNTQYLGNMTNAGIPDSAMMNDLETLVNAQVSTSVKKFGTGSLSFDGSSSYLYAYNPTAFLFGTGDFTVEAWVYPTSFGSERVILSTAGPTDAQGFTLNIGGGGALIIGFGAGSWTILTTSGGNLSTNQWQHVAISRSGNNFYAFVNGTQTWTTSNSLSLTNTNNAIYVGGRAGQNQYFVGYIDEPRITKGFCRYSSNFSVPTTAFPTY